MSACRVLGHELHRPDGVRGPGRPAEHAADRLARGQQRRPRPGQAVTFDARSSPTPTLRSPATTGTSTATARSTAPPSTATTDFAYGAPGSYTAKVAAKDFRGGAGNASTGVTVAAPPPACRSSAPPPGSSPPALSPCRSADAAADPADRRLALRCSVRAKLVREQGDGPQAQAQPKRTLRPRSRGRSTTTSRQGPPAAPPPGEGSPSVVKRAGLKRIPRDDHAHRRPTSAGAPRPSEGGPDQAVTAPARRRCGAAPAPRRSAARGRRASTGARAAGRRRWST